MKSELKAKFLQHLIDKKKGDEGFTLIELLVVVIIIGILAAIALPSFLNQANKARISEAQNYAGTFNRANQAYFVGEGSFTTLDNLKVGLKLADINAVGNYTFSSAGGSTAGSFDALGLKNGLLGVKGAVQSSTDAAGASETKGKVCTNASAQAVPTCTP